MPDLPEHGPSEHGPSEHGPVVRFNNVNIVFGNDPKRALPLMDA